MTQKITTEYRGNTGKKTQKGNMFPWIMLRGAITPADRTLLANYHAVKEMFQDCQAMWDITGDYDSYGLMFHWPSLTDEEKQRLEEIEESLDNYPILDEQEWCEVEQEWIDEAWNNWLEWDVQRYLNRLFEQVFPGLLEFERNENLRRLTEFFMEKHNQYYEFETGNGAVVVQIKHIFPDAMELLASPALVWADKIFLED